MLAPIPRRWLTRQKSLIVFGFCAVILYWFMIHGSQGGFEIGSKTAESTEAQPNEQPPPRNPEDEIKEEYQREYEAVGKLPGAGAIYGNTLNSLESESKDHLSKSEHLTPAEDVPSYSPERPFVYDPYPDFNSSSWLKDHAEYFPCEGPDGNPVPDLKVWKGHPRNYPNPMFGSYEALRMDGNMCYERTTRLGPYGLKEPKDTSPPAIQWDKVNWGHLQERCVQKNRARFDLQGQTNPYLTMAYAGEVSKSSKSAKAKAAGSTKGQSLSGHKLRRGSVDLHSNDPRGPGKIAHSRAGKSQESRTAILLRTYTGKSYSDNDKQVIRSLISELSLRTGGIYQVFLFVHVKDAAYAIWDDEATYQYVLKDSVPAEFKDMTILWNDEATQAMYPKLDPKKATVHVSQWLSVQKFIQEFPEFDYIWNWELDARVVGHNYDFLEKMASFAQRQPRRGIWERNERYYIPSVHGDYDTDFRKEVERAAGKQTIWGAPHFSFVDPVGPKPPVANPADDNYEWGVGEEADLITVAPMFNPIESGWVGAQEIWGFNDSTHATEDLPRRTTIVTQSRVSKRLLDIMHVENLRGNHISSEMATQTTALLHSLKAVYAPMPIWFDRPWEGKSLARWFNGGPGGQSGSHNCAMGWGREGRYKGSTWYYRSDPPQRLYLNWMGYEDTEMGGEEWEESHGRPCLPPMLLHPIKDVVPTPPGYQSESKLPYD